MRHEKNPSLLFLLLCVALAGLTAVLGVLLQSAWRAKNQALHRNAQAAVTLAVQDLAAGELSGQALRIIAAAADDSNYTVETRGFLQHEVITDDARPATDDSLHIMRILRSGGLAEFHSTNTRRGAPYDDDTNVAIVLQVERSLMVERVVGDLLQLEPRAIAERLSAGRIDSVLTHHLRVLEIPVEPRFAVVAAGDGESGSDVAALSNVAEPAALADTAPYRARLFSLDLAPPHYDLVVALPAARTIVLGQVWPLWAASVVFLLVTIVAFVRAWRTIDRQRRATQQVVAFVNNLTHEFKTPLATVSLACEALDGRAADPDSRRYVRLIREEGVRLGRQVDQILQLAQLERGELPRGTTRIDLNEVCRRLATAFTMQVTPRGGELALRLLPTPAWVCGDETHLAAMVDNLLDNAVKYSPTAPRVTLTTAMRDDHVQLEVSDSGQGIAPADQERVFEPYFRCPTGDRHDVKGHGLGLSYVRLLADLHDGDVQLTSRPGHGTRVRVRLPLVPPAAGGAP